MMLALWTSAFLVLGLAAAPALAQSQSQGAATPNTSSSADASGQTGHNPQGYMQNRDALQRSLQQAGFKDVHITAQAFAVHAKGPDGSPVVMMITPDQAAGMLESNASRPPAAPNGNAASDNADRMNSQIRGGTNPNNSSNQ